MNTNSSKAVTAEHCKATVYHRDQLRRTGRGPTGFEMHYTEDQCKRKPYKGGYCWQHKYLIEERLKK